MSNLGLNLPSIPFVLPILTATLSSLAIGGGIYNFQNPSEGAKVFGILLSDSKPSSSPTPIEEAYIKVHGIRNLATGLSGLSLLAFLQFSNITTASPVAAAAVRKAIGITFVVGTVVGLGDAWILSQLAQREGVSGEAERLATEKSMGHAFMAFPIAALGAAWLYAGEA